MRVLHLLAFAVATFSVSAQTPVKVTVFYESRCSDSVAFIGDQLKPTFDALGASRVNVDFVPYGKGTHRAIGNGFTFTNQHGTREYLGNKMQACAIDALKGDQRATVNFVACAMNSPYDAANTNGACFAGISTTTRTKIGQCNGGVEGDQLLARHGDRTHALVPKISLYPNLGYVPRVEINGVYNVAEEQMANGDLKGLICRKLQGTQQQCQSQALRSIPQGYAHTQGYPHTHQGYPHLHNDHQNIHHDHSQIPQSYPGILPQAYPTYPSYPNYPAYPGVTGYNPYPGYPAYNSYQGYQTPNSYPGYTPPTPYHPESYPGVYPTQSTNYPYQGYPSSSPQQPYPQPAPEP